LSLSLNDLIYFCCPCTIAKVKTQEIDKYRAHLSSLNLVNFLLPKAAYLHQSPKTEVHSLTSNISVQLNVSSEKYVHTLTLHFLRHFGHWLSRTIQFFHVFVTLSIHKSHDNSQFGADTSYYSLVGRMRGETGVHAAAAVLSLVLRRLSRWGNPSSYTGCLRACWV
jgi:hypothetical protein